MKKFISGFLCGAVLFGATSAYGAEAYQKIQAMLRSDIGVTLNGRGIVLSKPAINYNGSTYLSVRDVATILDKNVVWSNKDNKVIITDKLKEVTGPSSVSTKKIQPEVLKNYTTGADAFKINGDIFMALRSGSEKYGVFQGITYDPITKTVGFQGSQTIVHIVDKLNIDNPEEGFMYEGSGYIKESIFAQVGVEYNEKFNEFKELFTYGEKKKGISNGLTMILKYKENLNAGDFYEYWYSFNSTQLQVIAQRLGAELQQVNPSYDMKIEFMFKDDRLGSVIANADGSQVAHFEKKPVADAINQ